MKHLCFILTLFLFSSCYGQMIETNFGPNLYFNSDSIKSKNIKKLYLSEYSKYIHKGKVHLGKAYKSELLFDENGVAIKRLMKDGKRTDTVYVNEKFSPPYFDKSYLKEIIKNDENKYYVIKSSNDDENRVRLDKLGNVIYDFYLKHNTEGVTSVTVVNRTYDTLSRLLSYQISNSWLQFSYKSNSWDTVVISRYKEIYTYTLNKLVKMEGVAYHQKDSSQDSYSYSFTYRNGILHTIESDVELTTEIPEKYYAIIEDKKN